MHGLRLFSDVSARGNAAPSLLHGYASHTETDHAASRLLPLILHPDEKAAPHIIVVRYMKAMLITIRISMMRI